MPSKRADMKKDDLLAECKRQDALIKALNKELDRQKDAPVAAPAPGDELLALVLHVSGVVWNGTQKQLVRCATSGPMADKWLVRAGGKMFTTSGHPIAFIPWHQVKKSLQDKVAWDLEAGLEFLTK